MTALEHFPLGTPFRPSPAFVSWFIIDFILAGLFIVLCLVLPLFFSDSPAYFTGVVTPGIFVLAILVFATWTRLYYQSMSYELHEDEMRWRRGVWFRTTGIVPYNRITNLDIR